MENPKVRPHLKFYPEDSQRGVSEARQAHRWLHEMADNEITPIARLGRQDYYIHEPAMLRDVVCCIPDLAFPDHGLNKECQELIQRLGEEVDNWRSQEGQFCLPCGSPIGDQWV
jgi:hypothetical protein